MRLFLADVVFPITSDPVPNGILVSEEDGTIITVLKPGEEGYDISLAKKLDGWLVPGFINAHCHLELSHLKGKVNMRAGLDGFVEELMQLRQANDEEIISAAIDADKEMRENGIVGVGDISNGNKSFSVKNNSSIRYFTFIERFGLDPSRAEDAVKTGLQLLKELNQLSNNNKGNLTPHAPYSASAELLKGIADSLSEDGIISIHNQETESENELFVSGTGKMADRLKRMGLYSGKFPFQGTSSLASVFPLLPENLKIQLVHNTFMSAADFGDAGGGASRQRVYFCLCPSANLYIENCLPNIPMFIRQGLKITVGTDSLASNHQLSILKELEIIQRNYSQITPNELFKWATINGAELFNWEKEFGSFSHGKRPGILQIKDVDILNGKVLEDSSIYVC